MLVTVGTVILTILSACGLVLAVNFFIQIVGSLARSRPTAVLQGTRPPFTVIIPAHNEALGIARTLGMVKAQMSRGDRVVVVADNCTDETAAISAAAGAEVAVRENREQVGKGYALDHGLKYASGSAAPRVTIFVDADCEISEGALPHLAHVASSLNRPAQALYLMRTPADASAVTRLSEFAWIVKNQVRPLGAQRFGFPCQLMGSGMAFPADVLLQSTLATGHIVEDMKLGADLAMRGQYPFFCPEVVVTSEFASSDKGHQTQRVRWEHGHLSMIFSYVPKMLLTALFRWDSRLAWMALDIAIPPLVTFVLWLLLLTGLSVAFTYLTTETLPFLLCLASLLLLGMAILIALTRWGRPRLRARDLILVAPSYVARKFPILLRFVRKRETRWIRSERSQ